MPLLPGPPRSSQAVVLTLQRGVLIHYEIANTPFSAQSNRVLSEGSQAPKEYDGSLVRCRKQYRQVIFLMTRFLPPEFVPNCSPVSSKSLPYLPNARGRLFVESPPLALKKLLTQECSAFTISSKQCVSILSGQWFGENPPAVLAACVTPSTYRLKCLRAKAVGQRGAL